MSPSRSGISRSRRAFWAVSMVVAATLLLDGVMSGTAFGQYGPPGGRSGPPPGMGGPPPWVSGPGGPGGARGNPYGPGRRRPAKKKAPPKPAVRRPAGTPTETEYPFRVLMKDGRRLYGQVKDDGDGYMVTKKAGSIRVLKTEVERIEDTLTGATTKPAAPSTAAKLLNRPAAKPAAAAAAAPKK